MDKWLRNQINSFILKIIAQLGLINLERHLIEEDKVKTDENKS